MTQQAALTLQPLLRAAPEPDDLIARLLDEHASPIIKGILKSKLGSHAGDQHSRQEALPPEQCIGGRGRGYSGRHEQCVAFFLPDGMEVVVFVNSRISPGSYSLRKLVGDVYVNSLRE